MKYLAILSARDWCKLEDIGLGAGGVGRGNKLGKTGEVLIGSKSFLNALIGKLIPRAARATFAAPNFALRLLEPSYEENIF